MVSDFDLLPKSARERADYGFARVRDVAFDAVQSLWRRRKAQGWKQGDIARTLKRDRGWISRNLRGPGNWTLRTFGELIEALDGEVEISVHALEDPVEVPTNYDAYAAYGSQRATGTTRTESTAGAETFGLLAFPRTETTSAGQ